MQDEDNRLALVAGKPERVVELYYWCRVEPHQWRGLLGGG
jgi:hypothetical protein